MKVTWVMLALTMTSLCGVVVLDCTSEGDGLAEQFRSHITRARGRLVVWLLGVAAAIIPNLPGLYRKSGEDWPTSGPYLSTLASVMLLTLISLGVAARMHHRDNYSKPAKACGFVSGFLALILTSGAVALTWLYPDGAGDSSEAFIGWITAGLVGAGIVVAVGSEVLVAYLDDQRGGA